MDIEREDIYYQGDEYDDVGLQDIEQPLEIEEEPIEEPAEEPAPKKETRLDKRINELTWKAKSAEEQRAAEAALRQEAEERAKAAEERLAELTRAAQESSNQQLKQREAELLSARTRAEEDGDLSAITKITDDLMDVRFQLREKPVEAKRPEPEKVDGEALRRQEQPVEMHPAARQWVEKNQWISRPENSRLLEIALEIEADLMHSEGYIPGPALYRELTAKLKDHDEFSSVFKKNSQPSAPNHIAPPATSSGSERSKPGSLTPYDIQAIRMVGLDPNNPRARAAYLKNKGR